MKVQSEVVLVFSEGGEKHAILFQNGVTEFFRIKKATRDDVAQLLGADIPQVPTKLSIKNE